MFCTKCGRPVGDNDVVCTNCGKPTGIKPSFTPVQPEPIYQAPVVQPEPVPVQPQPVYQAPVQPEPVAVPEPVVVQPVAPAPDVPTFEPPKYDIPEAPTPITEKPQKAEGKKDCTAILGLALSALSCIVNTGNYATNFVIAFILALAGTLLSFIALIKTAKSDKANLLPALIGVVLGVLMIIIAPTALGITISNNIIYG